ncbi:MAG: hypothetical protein LBT55_02095 [Clostridiaceae bacterium]|jgi:hypothetical protein|nr:hypothetical protein [Clostridiaceae bacterium]
MSDENRSLFLKMSTAPEETDAPKKELPAKGRLKYVFGVFRAETNTLFRVNLLVILSLIPLGFLFFYYLPGQLNAVAAGFNFMGGIGIGYPEAVSSAAESQIAVYNVYQIFLLLATPCVWLFGVTLSGLNYICRKLLQKDKPAKLGKSFFTGIKKYWFNTLLTIVLFSLIALGVGSLVIYLLKNIAAGTATVGTWFAVIVPSLIALPILMLPLFMLPMSVFYRLSFKDILKNSVILLIKFPLFAVIIALVSVAPLVLVFAIQSSAQIFIAIIYAVFGITLTAIGWTGFGQYVFGAIMEPLGEMRVASKKEKDDTAPVDGNAANNKNKKKNVYVNPKQHKHTDKNAVKKSGKNGSGTNTKKK